MSDPSCFRCGQAVEDTLPGSQKHTLCPVCRDLVQAEVRLAVKAAEKRFHQDVLADLDRRRRHRERLVTIYECLIIVAIAIGLGTYLGWRIFSWTHR